VASVDPYFDRGRGLDNSDVLMKTRMLALVASGTVGITGASMASRINDPIVDYLTMNVPDRIEYIETLDHVNCARIDMDGDEKEEVFIGAPYKYSGSMEVLWVGYRPVEGGFERITPADEDIIIGSFEDIYAGPLTEIGREGLATADEIEVDNPESGNVAKVGMLRFYYIANGRLIQDERGALDLAVPEQKTTYERYFGKDRVTRKATIESLSREQLEAMGYTIPNWEPPPP